MSNSLQMFALKKLGYKSTDVYTELDKNKDENNVGYHLLRKEGRGRKNEGRGREREQRKETIRF